MTEFNLSELQKDALKEIGNIGAGNAATALANFLDRKINMTVPRVEIIPIEDVPEVTGDIEEEIIGVLLKVRGEAPGSILFLLKRESSEHLLELIFKNNKMTGDDELKESAITEIGNIISGSYLSAINQITGFNLCQSVPAFARDMAGAILSSSLLSVNESSDYAILIETQFFNGTKQIRSNFFLIPDPGSLKKIFSSIGLMQDE
jgi:chemotaxis protein CheC